MYLVVQRFNLFLQILRLVLDRLILRCGFGHRYLHLAEFSLQFGHRQLTLTLQALLSL